MIFSRYKSVTDYSINWSRLVLINDLNMDFIIHGSYLDSYFVLTTIK